MPQTFRFDSETFPIRPGLLTPELVCLQYALDDDANKRNGDINIVLAPQAEDILTDVLQNPDLLLEAHNGGFDYATFCAKYPHLTPWVFKALADMRGRDTMLRQQLLQIRYGTMPESPPKGYWSLGGIVKRRLGREIDKSEESFRLKYALVHDKPVDQWPSDAVRYAQGDIIELRNVSRDQSADPYQPPDEWLQVATAFVMQLAATWGLRVDPWKLGWSRMVLLNDEQRCVDVLTEAGLFRDGSVSQIKVREAVERACAKAQMRVPKTKPSKKHEFGQTQIDVDTCDALAKYDSTLTAYSQHNTNVKMLSTYLEPMDRGTQHAMTSRPNALVSTGRTSWGGAKLQEYNPWWPEAKYPKQVIKVGTNMQNWPQMFGIRECVVPREGHYLCSVDYNSLELRTLGQACLWLLGRSTFAEGYQSDPNWDPHSYFGGQLIGIDYTTAMKRKKTDPSFKTGPRSVGKASNFSLPGGVGARRLAQMFQELYESGELPEKYSVDDCYGIKDKWLNAYPEMPDYFELAAFHAETGTPLKQLVSNRLRGGLTFPAAANSWFQGLAGDLFKRAMFAVSQATYCEPDSPLFNSRVVAGIHDELLLEVPIDLAHEATLETERLMVAAAHEVCPDVPFAAEGCLMTYWTKAAEPRYDANKRLIPWA